MRLSEQAIATLMVTLQKCILEQVDITELLGGYNFQVNEENETLLITNPPSSLASPVLVPDTVAENNFTTGSD